MISSSEAIAPPSSTRVVFSREKSMQPRAYPTDRLRRADGIRCTENDAGA